MANRQETTPEGLIVEILDESALGQDVRVHELRLKDARLSLARAAEDKTAHRGMTLLADAMTVDGKKWTTEEMDALPGRKLKAIMRAVEVALRLNGLSDDGTSKTPEEAAKNG